MKELDLVQQALEKAVLERKAKILGTTVQTDGAMEVQKDYYPGDSHIHKNVNGWSGREHVVETRRLRPRIISSNPFHR